MRVVGLGPKLSGSRLWAQTLNPPAPSPLQPQPCFRRCGPTPEFKIRFQSQNSPQFKIRYSRPPPPAQSSPVQPSPSPICQGPAHPHSLFSEPQPQTPAAQKPGQNFRSLAQPPNKQPSPAPNSPNQVSVRKPAQNVSLKTFAQNVIIGTQTLNNFYKP